MAQHSPIEWTDDTFNPWWGCVKVSAGCQNCYAEKLANRFGHSVWGVRGVRRRFGEDHWRKPALWNAQAEASGKPRRVFCASMADVFEELAPADDRERLWSLVDATPHLRWLLLTKRPHLITEYVPPDWLTSPRPNVWFGTSVESPDVFHRLHELAAVPAAVRFVSAEPLLAPLPDLPLAGIDWLIVGGESGSSARPMDASWVREIRNQCVDDGVRFFFKQWGGRFNKEKGRELDGRTWDQFPREGVDGWDTGLAEISSTASVSGRNGKTGS